MTLLLQGKSIIVTGAGSGIGRATALVMAREGARVLVADRSRDGAVETVEMIKAAGGEAADIVVDIAENADVENMVAKAVKLYGRLDAAYNNAGVHGSQLGAAGAKLADIPEEAVDALFKVNLKGVWLCMKHQIRQMEKQGGGAIVNTGSIGGIVGLRGSSAYVASKHGVLGLTRSAAIEYAGAGIRVNAVCPGFTDTPMASDSMKVRGKEILAVIPAGRLGKPEEIGETVAFLCSDRAAYINGAAYAVDGAYLA